MIIGGIVLLVIADIDKGIEDSRLTSFANDTTISAPSTLIYEAEKLKDDRGAVCNWEVCEWNEIHC